MSVVAQARPWTRAEYHRAAEAGVFRPEERLELLDGEVICKMPQSGRHVNALADVFVALAAVFAPPDHVVWTQIPLALADDSEPEPDIVVLRGPRDQYRGRMPEAGDAALLVEISDTTLPFDTGRKAARYAEAGIADYWVLNLPQRRLEVRRDPGPVAPGELGYRALQIYTTGMAVAPLAAPGAVVRVADLLPATADETENT